MLVKRRSVPFLLVPILVAWVSLGAQSRSLTLDQVLSGMDERAASLRSMTATITQQKWTDILESFDAPESGSFRFLRNKGKVYLRKEITKPQPNILVIAEGKVLFYQPGVKQAVRHDLGQNKDKAEYLLLGFGSNKEALKKAYQIRMLDRERVAGRETYPIELSPRSARVSSIFSHIVLWIDSGMWIPIQQKLVEPNKDYLLLQFASIKLNPSLSTSAFDLKLPKDVQLVKP